MSLIVDYQSNGMITVMTQSKTSFSRLTILVYDDSDRLIVEKNVEEDELLRARELGKVDFQNDEGKEIGTAMLYSEDILHWKFQYALNDLKLAPGIYKICIIVHQGQKTAEVFNEVRVSDSDYTYGCDRVEKEY